MKLQTFFLMLACLAMLAAGAAPTAIDAPAPSAFVDTEAVTNVAFDRDGNADGVLGRTEADLLHR